MEAKGSISISNVGSKDEQINLSYSIKDISSEEDAKKLKTELDEILKKKGAATSLDEWITAK